MLASILVAPSVAHAAVVRVQDDDARLRYTSRTNHVVTRYATGRSRRTLSAAASVEASFTGTSVAWVGPKSPAFGQAKVFLDGSQVATVACDAATLAERRVLWQSGSLSDGVHALRIEAVDPVAVDAFDVDGAVGTLSRPVPLVRVEDTSSLLGYTDFFRRSASAAASGGSVHVSAVPGASVTVSFTGTEVVWLAQRGPSGGRARVTLDGADQGTVSLYATALVSKRVLYSRAGLADGPHTLTITALGTKDTAANGRSASIDAFDVAGSAGQAVSRVEADDRRIRRGGAWKTVGLGGGAVRLVSGSPGASAAVVFSGTGAAVSADVGPGTGKLDVYLDGVKQATVDLYSASTDRSVKVWEVHGLTPGTHTIGVKPAGARNPSSSSDAVALDAFLLDGEAIVGGTPSGHRRAEANSTLFARSGLWRSAATVGAARGSVLTTSRRASKTYVEFNGTGFSWVANRSPKSGRARVKVDGKVVATVSLYSKTTEPQRTVYTLSGLKNRHHHVVIEAVGSKESASRGTGVTADYFEAEGRFVRASRPTPFHYPWSTYIVIDKSECNLYWVKNGSLVKVYRCAVGRPSMPTPNRYWRIGMKYHTDPGGIYGPRKMRLFKQTGSGFAYTAYNIHGTNQPWVIGTWASHGCIRMYNRDVLELFPQVPVGTMVVTKD